MTDPVPGSLTFSGTGVLGCAVLGRAARLGGASADGARRADVARR